MMCASLQSVASGIDLAGDPASLEVQDDDLRESRLFEFCTPPDSRPAVVAGIRSPETQVAVVLHVFSSGRLLSRGRVGLFQSSAPIQLAI